MSISFDAAARWWQNWTFSLRSCRSRAHVRDVGIGAPELRARRQVAGCGRAAQPTARSAALDPAVIRESTRRSFTISSGSARCVGAGCDVRRSRERPFDPAWRDCLNEMIP